MSSKKDKFLESAQKFIVKGQLDRAIRDYEQVVALDPNDIRHRQRLAELLVRASRTIEAIGEYEAIGKYYADNGFYLKAIAVFKQVQKLDPNDIKTCLNLATLNEKQGLTGNALTEYGKVFSHFEKSGKLNDALNILESMIDIDPENLNTRLKLAETCFALRMTDKAYEDFSQIAVLLRKRGDQSAFSQVSDRIRYLFPNRKEFTLEILASLIKSGDAATAIQDLREITKKEQTNLNAWNLLLEAYRAAGARDEIKPALQKMARIFPDDPAIKEGLKQCALEDGDAFNSPLSEEPVAIPVDMEEIPQEVEEEMQIDLSEEAAAGPVEVAVAAGPEQPRTGAADDTGAAVEFEHPDEIDLELDFTEDELEDIAEIYSEADGEDHALSGLAEEMEEPAAYTDLLSTGPGIAEQEPFFGEGAESVEEGMDIFSEIEDEDAASALGQDKYSPDGLFSAFRKGLDQQLDKGDTETRYNLGIAFKEMGLFDEAIAEFEAAAHDPQRRIDCITLQGICCRDKGDYASAEEIFKNAIEQEGLSSEELLSINYELALLYENRGRDEEALVIYRQITAVQNDFRDAKEKVARLQGNEEFYDLDLVDVEGDDFK